MELVTLNYIHPVDNSTRIDLSMGNVRYTVNFRSAPEKAEWLNDIKQCIEGTRSRLLNRGIKEPEKLLLIRAQLLDAAADEYSRLQKVLLEYNALQEEYRYLTSETKPVPINDEKRKTIGIEVSKMREGIQQY